MTRLPEYIATFFCVLIIFGLGLAFVVAFGDMPAPDDFTPEIAEIVKP